MWKDFHPTILPFLEKNLLNHKMVKDFEKIETGENIFYKIKRIWKGDLIVWVCDSYSFNEFDYYNKPVWIDFIYLAKPEASNPYFDEECKRDWINMWKFWALMWVLYQDDIVNYIPVDRRGKEEHKKN